MVRTKGTPRRHDLTHTRMARAFQRKGYTLISSDVRSIYAPVNVQCAKGHTSQMSYRSVVRKRRCPTCVTYEKTVDILRAQ